MKIRFKNIAFQALIGLLAIQTLNLSVNSIDFYDTPVGVTTPANQDYVDSILEYLVENVLGYSKDTIKDKANPECSSKQQQTPVHIDLKWYPGNEESTNFCESVKDVSPIIPRTELVRNLYFEEVPVKPPEISVV